MLHGTVICHEWIWLLKGQRTTAPVEGTGTMRQNYKRRYLLILWFHFGEFILHSYAHTGNERHIIYCSNICKSRRLKIKVHQWESGDIRDGTFIQEALPQGWKRKLMPSVPGGWLCRKKQSVDTAPKIYFLRHKGGKTSTGFHLSGGRCGREIGLYKRKS